MTPQHDTDPAAAWARYRDSLDRATQPRPLPVYEPRAGDGCLHQFAVSFLLMAVIVTVILAACWAFT